MNRVQRVVLVVYCFVLVYCCVWVPWYFQETSGWVRFGYGWIWSPPLGSGSASDEAAGLEPNLPIIGLRLLAATALGVVGFLLAEKWKGSP